MDLHLIVSIFAAVGVFLIFFGIDNVLSSHGSNIKLRLDRYAARQVVVPVRALEETKKVKKGPFGSLAAIGASSQIATDLARADLKLTAGEYMLFNLASVVLGFLAAMVIFRGSLVLAIVGGLGGFHFPRWYVRFRQRKRLTAFNNQLGDTIVLLSNSLRSGYSLLQSMETASKELAPPISIEFARVTREIGLGLTVQEALANLLRRIPSDDLDLMITAINVQHE